jgi:hypothetical protein
MKIKTDYKLALQVVGAVVCEWAPYSLLLGGCPHDEFDAEIASIVSEITSIGSVHDATLSLSRVYSSAFEAERFTYDKCRDAGANRRAEDAKRRAGADQQCQNTRFNPLSAATR